jgi:hypothetical protein
MPTRDCKSVGGTDGSGRLCRRIGWSNSPGWYEGFRLLAAVDPTGVITGFCFSAASTADQQMAEAFFAVRARPRTPGSSHSVGSASSGPYVADKGFEGAENHRGGGPKVIRGTRRSHTSAQAQHSRRPCSKGLRRRWVAGIRPIVETV